MTDPAATAPLISGLKKAVIHFSKAAIEVASGVADVVAGVTQTVRGSDHADGDGNDGPQKIEIE